LDTSYARQLSESQQARFDAETSNCICVRDWLREAEKTMDIKTISASVYLNECFNGDGFVLVGGASMFLDPVFSAGVTQAMRGSDTRRLRKRRRFKRRTTAAI